MTDFQCELSGERMQALNKPPLSLQCMLCIPECTSAEGRCSLNQNLGCFLSFTV